MAYDFVKEQRELYAPPKTPVVITVPKMNFVAVRGMGDPNDEQGAYKKAIPLLYGIAWTIKMSYRGSYQIDGFFEHKVPPLEGFWWQDGVAGVDYSRKNAFNWISLLRLPDFVGKNDFDWAVAEATKKKKLDFSPAEFFTYDEGLCVQCLHIGPFDDEPATIALMDAYAVEQGYRIDLSSARFHHEIYVTDPNKTDPSRMKTVVRHPIKSITRKPTQVG